MHEIRSINGTWTLVPDSDNRGIEAGWFEKFPSAGALSQVVPAAWQHAIPDTGPDVVWYRRRERLDRPLQAGERLWLRFESVATDCRAWVNGVEVGEHSGNWVPFGLEVTDAVRGSQDLDIILRVDRVRPGPVKEVNGRPQQGGHITKGFHDVLSMQAAGVWLDVRLERTGALCARTDGLWVSADVRSGQVRIEVELESGHAGGWLDVAIEDPDGVEVAQVSVEIEPDYVSRAVALSVEPVRRWSIESPALYRVTGSLRVQNGVSQELQERFGFRRVEVSGDGQRIVLNGRPVFISGILDWGHEPAHISPSPTREELRERFAGLQERGFNCVCVCMWYPPKWFYDTADEMGMLIWQEHPVWKSDMSDERVEEYKKQFVSFFRRDRNHPSVAIVSGSCEHEEFNPRLGAWWWEQAKHLLADRLVQIQTAFLAWTDLTKTDTYDEHTYEGSGRWVAYLRDLDAALGEREPKPMLMGESVMYVSWPDVERYDALGAKPWWMPPGLESVRKINASIDALDGAGASRKIREIGIRYNEAGRKFQTELVRGYQRNAGLVANGMRDVPLCPCGIMDDFNEWKFDGASMRAWMGASVLLLRTPDERRGFTGGRRLAIELGVSNYGTSDLSGTVELDVSAESGFAASGRINVSAACGQVRFFPGELELPQVAHPTPMRVRARIGHVSNAWTLWVLPEGKSAPREAAVLGGSEFTEAEQTLAFEELKYSSGWGLPNRSWRPRYPDPGVLLPGAAQWWGEGQPERGTRVLVTHRLTESVLRWLERGGRVLHMPSTVKDGLPTRFVTGFGQVPWIRAKGPLARFGRDWVEGLLDYDLMRTWTRVLPVSELNLADALEPYVRMLYTHDMVHRVPQFDALSAARVGKGVLAVCCLDLHDEPGRLLLGEILAWLAGDEGLPGREVDVEMLSELAGGSLTSNRAASP